MKVKVPLTLKMWVILFCIIIFLLALFFYPDITEDTFFFIKAVILAWIVLIVLALIGAIFVGMFLSHRILSIGGFTPFEEEMLKMREDINTINRKLDSLITQRNPGNNSKVKDEKGDED